MSNSVSDLRRTPIFKWCMLRSEPKNGHQKELCWKEIGLLGYILLTILDAIVDIVGGGGVDHLMIQNLYIDME